MLRFDTGSRLFRSGRFLGSVAAMLALLCAPRTVLAEASALEIIGDRPDFTESAATIPPFHLQGELGVAYSTTAGEKLLTAPDLLLRFGVADHLEVRLGAPSAETALGSSQATTDLGGLEIGLKTTFAVGDKWALGLLPFVVLPLKEDRWSNSGLELGLKGVWAVDLTNVISLGGNMGVAFHGVAPASADFEPEYLASLSMGLSLLKWLGAFVETYGLMNNDADVAAVVDGGFTFLVAPRLQLDLHAGVGLTHPARGFDLGAGAIFLL
jgi:hypothetical protein